MGKSSAPPAPDYAAAAVAQGQENRETAQFNAGANRVNQYTPQGSSTWTIRPGADLNNPQPGDYIQTTTLSPTQQAIYDQTAAIDNSLLGTASEQLARVRNTFNSPIDLSGLPGWRTSGQTGPQPAANATSPKTAPMAAIAPPTPTGAMPGPQTNQLAAILQGLAGGMSAPSGGSGWGGGMPSGGGMSFSDPSARSPGFGPGMASGSSLPAGGGSPGMEALIQAMMARRAQ